MPPIPQFARIDSQGKVIDGNGNVGFPIAKDVGDVTGKTNGQIDALLGYVPADGTMITGTVSGRTVTLVRRASLWTLLNPTDGQAGMYAPNIAPSGQSSVALTASTAYAARFVPDRPLSIVSVAFNVTTASGSNDPVDIGFYSSDLTTKIASTGATLGYLNSTGAKNVAMPSTVNLSPGVVYYAAIAAGAAGSSLMTASLTNAAGSTLFGTAAPALEIGNKATSYPLPASLAGAAGTGQVPLLALRES